MGVKRYSLLTAGNGHQAANKKKALRIVEQRFDGHDVTRESMVIPGWGDCQVAAYTSTDGAMIANASNPQAFGELDWHNRDHLVLLREIPDPKQPRCVIYFCAIEDLFEAPKAKWIGKAGLKWTHVSKIAKHKEVVMTDELAAYLAD